MSTEVHVFEVTTPAGTAKASPLVTALTMLPRIVDEIEIFVPDGPRGELGFALGSSGVHVLPKETGTFIVTNDEKIRWPLSDLWDSGSWQCFSYNTGTYDHTIEVRFLTSPTQGQQSQGGPLDLVGQQLGVPAPGTGLPGLPPAPQLPPFALPPPPALPSFGVPGIAGPGAAPRPSLTPTEDDPMRFVKITLPDGTRAYLTLLSDASLDGYTTYADSRPKGRIWPPGSWLAITEFDTYQGSLYIRGIGLDKKVWQTTATIADTLNWADPVAVIE